MSKKGILYLIPVPIADNALQTLSPEILKHTAAIKHFFVENVRTARRFLKAIHPGIVIDDLEFAEINKHSQPDIPTFKNWLNRGYDVGIISESGCPGIADPGSDLVAVAQKEKIKVVPLTGPNSLILALMASGLNGQSFCFNGYLPLKEPARSNKIKLLEQLSAKENQTQLFIETPYRNNTLLDELLKQCRNHTHLCIALNITADDAFIKTKTIEDWKKEKPALPKAPAVFLLLSS